MTTDFEDLDEAAAASDGAGAPDKYALEGSVPEYLAGGGPDLLRRLQPLTDWLDHRYESGVDPYSKFTDGRIGPISAAHLRKGDPVGGLNFASQDYLNLSSHPRVGDAAKSAIDLYGLHSAGSAALMGNSAAAVELERRLASFLSLDDVTLFPTGWAAGYGIVKFLARPGDHIIIDVLAHASLMEGARNSGASVSTSPHLSVEGVTRRLKRIRAADSACGILVVTETLFSMDSDIADLSALQAVCTEYNATLLVDCAHDLGALGPTGRGVMELQQVLGTIDVVMGSFSKSFASNGGFVATNHRALKLALRYACGPQTFSNALSPVQCEVVRTCLDIVDSAEGTELRGRLMGNIVRLREGLNRNGFSVLGQPSAIVPVVLGGNAASRLITREVLRSGALVNLAEFPAVAKNGCRWRLQVMAQHTAEQIDAFIGIATAARDRVQAGLD